MADEAVTALRYDASGAEAGARIFQKSSKQILDAVQQAEKQVGLSNDSMTAATKRFVTSMSNDAKFLDSYARRFDPLNAAVVQAQREHDRLSRIMSGSGENAQRAGEQFAISQRRLAEATRAAQGHVTTTTAMGQAARKTTTDLRGLTLQLNDIIPGLLSGQRPMQVLLQQGPQVAQAFGGWGAGLRALVSPIGLAVAGLTAIAVSMGVIITRAASLESASRQIGVSLRTMAGASGLTTADVQGTIDQQYRQPGFGRADTTAAARQLLGNRDIRGQDFGAALDLAREYALVTGTELPAALDALIPKLTGGAAGLKQLDQQYGILTADQIKYIDSLDRQGRQQDIVRIGIDAMSARFRGQGVQAMSEFSRAVDDAGKVLGGAIDAWVRNDPVIKGILATFSATAKAAREATSGTSKPRTRDDVEREIAAAQADLAQGGGEAFYLKRIAVLEEELRAKSYVGPQGAADEVDKRYADLARIIKETEGAEKKNRAFVDSIDAMGVAARKAADDYGRLLGLLRSTIDPSELQRITDALDRAGVAQQRQWTANDPQMVADQERIDAERIQRAGRTERAIVEARIRAEREADAAIQDHTLDKAARAAFIEDKLKPIIEAQGAAVRDLMDDIDAAARHSLEIARAYGTGLKEGYLADVKAAVQDMIRTTPGLEGQEAALMRQKLQTAAAQSVAQLGQQNGTLRPQVEAAERMAAAEERGAAAIREVSIANQVALGTYEARVRAELANSPAITAEYEKQKAILEELIRRQTESQRISEAVALNRQFDPAAQFRTEVDKIKDLAETGKVSAEAYRKAWEDAYIKAGQASDSWVQGATAGLLEYARQAERVGSAIADIMYRTFASIEDTLARFLLGMRIDLRTVLQDISLDIARTVIRQNITGPIASALAGMFGGASGNPNVQAPAGGYSSVGALISAQGLGGSGASGSSGFNPFGMFGQGGSLGSFLSTPISSLFGGGSSLGGAAGAMTGGGISVGGGLGALSGIGNGIYQLTQGNAIGGIGSMIGAGVSLIPGIGQIAGPVISIASTLLGGLLGGKKEYSSAAAMSYNPATGKYGGRLAFNKDGAAAPQVPEIGDAMLKLMGQYGGSITSGMAPPSFYTWAGKYKSTDGSFDAGITENAYFGNLAAQMMAGGMSTDEANLAARRAIWTPGGDAALPFEGPSTDSQGVLKQLTVLLAKLAVREGSITGLSDTSSTIISNFQQADPDALSQALAWGRDTYDELIRAVPATDAEKAMKQINDSFKSAISTAKEYALATDELVVAQKKAVNQYASDFNQSISDRILGATDPAELQRVQLDRTYDALRKEAAYLNEQYAAGLTDTLININDIERAYGLEREKIVSASTESLIALQKRLLYGDLSGATPAATVTGTSASFDATLAQAMAGSSTALDSLAGVGADYVSSLQSAYGNTEKFASGRDRVLTAIEGLIGNAGASVGSTGGTSNDNAMTSQALTEMRLMYQSQSAQLADALEKIARLTAAFERAA